jgi:spermidine synthase
MACRLICSNGAAENHERILMSDTTDVHKEESPFFRGRYLSLVLFLTGASVLVVEIIGARMISPFFGASIYVWSALITVTLMALAAGYWWGGRYAGRRPGTTGMYDVVLASAVLLVVVPLLRVPVLEMLSPLGVRLGSFLAVIVLFLPSLFALGMATPCAVGVASGGATAAALTGRLYAISTIGSVAGALAAGYFLLPIVSVDGIFTIFAAFLAMASAAPFVSTGRHARVVAVFVVLLLCLIELLWPARLPRSGQAVVLFRQESPYADVRVIENASGRSLLVNGIMQGSMDRDGLPADRYFYAVDALVQAYRPNTRDSLVIGLGTGAYPKLQQTRGLNTDVVEIDPVVSSAAKRYFGYFEKAGALYVQDGRAYLRSTIRKYDCVFIDVYAAESLPIHLFTKESFQLAAGVLREGGIVAVNFHDERNGQKNTATRSLVRTLGAVFRDVRAFEVQHWHDSSIANIVFLASHHPLTFRGVYAPLNVSATGQQQVPLSVSVEEPGGILLTDVYNPLDSIYNPISESMRRATMLAFSAELMR